MDEKKSFGAYIRKKRQEAGLTQRQLAEQLFVAESTVSKWERGLSYPDVTLIPEVCRRLGISEHEFFAACDDVKGRAQEKDARAWRRTVLAWWWFFAAGYAAALLTCFICDLAIFHRLDWFWIVLTSLMLAFSFTNLPMLIKRERAVVCMGAASLSLFSLLLACWAYVGDRWILGGLAITAACLALPWTVWALWRFYGKHMAVLTMGTLTLWVFGLLAVIRLFTGGNWLLGFAFPIAAFCLAYLWLYFAAARWLRVNYLLKAGVFALLTAFATPLGNSFSGWMMPNQKTPALADYFAWGHMLTWTDVNGFSWVNVLVFAVMLVTAWVLLAAGMVLAVKRKSPR